MSEQTTQTTTPTTEPAQAAAPTPPVQATTPPQAATVDMDAITTTAERQAEKKAEAVVRDMLKRQGLDDTAIGEMLTEYKSKRQTPEQVLADKDSKISTLETSLQTTEQTYTDKLKKRAAKDTLREMKAKPGAINLLLKAVELNTLELDDNDDLKNPDALKPLVEQYADLFESEQSATTTPPVVTTDIQNQKPGGKGDHGFNFRFTPVRAIPNKGE